MFGIILARAQEIHQNSVISPKIKIFLLSWERAADEAPVTIMLGNLRISIKLRIVVGLAVLGIAVVAGELKALAAQTARATVEITQKIGAIQARADSAVTAVTNVRSTIDRLAEMSNSVAASVEEQAAVTSDIARNVNEVMSDVERISASIGDITRASITTCGGAIEALWASEDLGATARGLQSDASEFVKRIRA
jgi:methyl-accepting chemotaxis protein